MVDLPKLGQTIGPYRILRVFGSNERGTIYEVEILGTTHRAALQFLPANAINAATRELLHPIVRDLLKYPGHNIARIYQVGTHEGQIFIASELFDGVTLKHFIGGSPIPLFSLLSLSIEIAGALEIAHSHGIVHGRLTPSCILVTPGKHAEVFDFGITGLLPLVVNESKVRGRVEKVDQSEKSRQEEYGSEVSAVAYKSPERILVRSIDIRSDVFSFGAILYEMATGRRAFLGETAIDVSQAILYDRIDTALLFELLPNNIAKDFETLIKRALEKEPERRYQETSEMERALKKMCAVVFPVPDDSATRGFRVPNFASGAKSNPSAQPAEGEYTRIISPKPTSETDSDSGKPATSAGAKSDTGTHQAASEHTRKVNIPASTEPIDMCCGAPDDTDEVKIDLKMHQPGPQLGSAPSNKGSETTVSEKGPERQEVWYATNRILVDSSDLSQGFGNTRDPGGNVHFGRCDVFVPKSHSFGSLGTPWWKRWLRLRFSDDHLKIIKRKSSRSPEEFYLDLRQEIETSEEDNRQLLVYLHGYCVSFDEAALRAAQMAVDLKPPGITAFFSWPSSATLSGYLADADRIAASEPAITEFLTRLATETGAETVNIIAHSMGNRGLARAIQRITANASRAGISFGQLILAAPDIEVALFRDLAKLYPLVSKRTTMYVSSRDKALGMSKWLQDSDRAGFTPPVTVVPNIDTVAVSDIDLSLLGHGYYAEAEGVLYDIAEVLRHNSPPGKRTRIRPVAEALYGKPAYWMIAR